MSSLAPFCPVHARDAVFQYGITAMHRHELFEAHLDVIERSIRRVCQDARVAGADAEDFASAVKLALLANEGAILNKFEGRSSFSAYITVVVRRLLVDQLRAEGRWYASAEARKRGEAAVLLDRLLHRDHRTFAEAAAIVAGQHPGMTIAELQQIANALPARTARPRLVEIDEEDEDHFASPDSAEERVLERDHDERAARTSRVMQDALAAMTPQDRLVLRLRFADGASIADIARALRLEQRPLYRRIEALLAQLRTALRQAGLDAALVTDLIGGSGIPLDFGMRRDEQKESS